MLKFFSSLALVSIVAAGCGAHVVSGDPDASLGADVAPAVDQPSAAVDSGIASSDASSVDRPIPAVDAGPARDTGVTPGSDAGGGNAEQLCLSVCRRASAEGCGPSGEKTCEGSCAQLSQFANCQREVAIAFGCLDRSPGPICLDGDLNAQACAAEMRAFQACFESQSGGGGGVEPSPGDAGR